MNVIVTGGGTGGHFYPAFIIYSKINLKDNAKNVYYLGSDYGIEKRLAFELKLNYKLTKARGFIGKTLFHKIMSLILNFFSFLYCCFFIISKNIDVVVATGGYVSLPALAAAVLLQKKIFIQEQNSYPGITTKIFGRFAERIFISFDESKKYITAPAKKFMVINTPVRDEFYLLKSNIQKKNIAVVGGSQGSKILNEIIFESLDFFRENKITVHWITGRQFYEKYKACSDEFIKVYEYCNDIHKLLTAAEIIISRAGATSIAEFRILNKKVLFIPFAAATHNHQYYNAVSYCKNHQSDYITEKELNRFVFIDKLQKLINSSEKKNEEQYKENSAQIIADIVIA